LFAEVPSPIKAPSSMSSVNDFKRQPLLVNPLSYAGPCMAKADVNHDGLEDIYVGGENGSAGALYLQQKNGSFEIKKQASFEAHRKYRRRCFIF
jgi:hypothetical protein